MKVIVPIFVHERKYVSDVKFHNCQNIYVIKILFICKAKQRSLAFWLADFSYGGHNSVEYSKIRLFLWSLILKAERSNFCDTQWKSGKLQRWRRYNRYLYSFGVLILGPEFGKGSTKKSYQRSHGKSLSHNEWRQETVSGNI